MSKQDGENQTAPETVEVTSGTASIRIGETAATSPEDPVRLWLESDARMKDRSKFKRYPYELNSPSKSPIRGQQRYSGYPDDNSHSQMGRTFHPDRSFDQRLGSIVSPPLHEHYVVDGLHRQYTPSGYVPTSGHQVHDARLGGESNHKFPPGFFHETMPLYRDWNRVEDEFDPRDLRKLLDNQYEYLRTGPQRSKTPSRTSERLHECSKTSPLSTAVNTDRWDASNRSIPSRGMYEFTRETSQRYSPAPRVRADYQQGTYRHQSDFLGTPHRSPYGGKSSTQMLQEYDALDRTLTKIERLVSEQKQDIDRLIYKVSSPAKVPSYSPLNRHTDAPSWKQESDSKPDLHKQDYPRATVRDLDPNLNYTPLAKHIVYDEGTGMQGTAIPSRLVTPLADDDVVIDSVFGGSPQKMIPAGDPATESKTFVLSADTEKPRGLGTQKFESPQEVTPSQFGVEKMDLSFADDKPSGNIGQSNQFQIKLSANQFESLEAEAEANESKEPPMQAQRVNEDFLPRGDQIAPGTGLNSQQEYKQPSKGPVLGGEQTTQPVTIPKPKELANTSRASPPPPPALLKQFQQERAPQPTQPPSTSKVPPISRFEAAEATKVQSEMDLSNTDRSSAAKKKMTFEFQIEPSLPSKGPEPPRIPGWGEAITAPKQHPTNSGVDSARGSSSTSRNLDPSHLPQYTRAESNVSETYDIYGTDRTPEKSG